MSRAKVLPTAPIWLSIILAALLRSLPGVSLPKGLELSVLSRYQLIDRFSDRLFPLQPHVFPPYRASQRRGRPADSVSGLPG